jgi:hypothetical protein
MLAVAWPNWRWTALTLALADQRGRRVPQVVQPQRLGQTVRAAGRVQLGEGLIGGPNGRLEVDTDTNFDERSGHPGVAVNTRSPESCGRSAR